MLPGPNTLLGSTDPTVGTGALRNGNCRQILTPITSFTGLKIAIRSNVTTPELQEPSSIADSRVPTAHSNTQFLFRPGHHNHPMSIDDRLFYWDPL